MNRLNKENTTMTLANNMEFKSQEPFLLCKSSNNEIIGIWFYDSSECKRMANLLTRLSGLADNEAALKEAIDKEVGQAQTEAAATSGNAGIFDMLQKAKEDYDRERNPIKKKNSNNNSNNTSNNSSASTTPRQHNERKSSDTSSNKQTKRGGADSNLSNKRGSDSNIMKRSISQDVQPRDRRSPAVNNRCSPAMGNNRQHSSSSDAINRQPPTTTRDDVNNDQPNGSVGDDILKMIQGGSQTTEQTPTGNHNGSAGNHTDWGAPVSHYDRGNSRLRAISTSGTHASTDIEQNRDITSQAGDLAIFKALGLVPDADRPAIKRSLSVNNKTVIDVSQLESDMIASASPTPPSSQRDSSGDRITMHIDPQSDEQQKQRQRHVKSTSPTSPQRQTFTNHESTSSLQRHNSTGSNTSCKSKASSAASSTSGSCSSSGRRDDSGSPDNAKSIASLLQSSNGGSTLLSPTVLTGGKASSSNSIGNQRRSGSMSLPLKTNGPTGDAQRISLAANFSQQKAATKKLFSEDSTNEKPSAGAPASAGAPSSLMSPAQFATTRRLSISSGASCSISSSASVSREQLRDTLVNLLQTDDTFVDTIHASYIASLKQKQR